MVIGSFFAIGNGVLLPVSLILFGDLIGDFAKFGRLKNENSGNPSAVTFDIEGNMVKFAAYYAYLGAGSFVAGYFHTAFWSIASVRQAKRIRTKCFECILRKDIGWFDTTDAGELSTRLTE